MKSLNTIDSLKIKTINVLLQGDSTVFEQLLSTDLGKAVFLEVLVDNLGIIENSSNALSLILNSSTARNLILGSDSVSLVFINSAVVVNAILNNSTARSVFLTTASSLRAIANSIIAMRIVAGSSVAMNTMLKNSTARTMLDLSPYLKDVAPIMFNTCDSDSNNFQKYTVNLSLSSSISGQYWTPTSGTVSSPPSKDVCICFSYLIMHQAASGGDAPPLRVVSLEYTKTSKLPIVVVGNTGSYTTTCPEPFAVCLSGIGFIRLLSSSSSSICAFNGYKAL